MRRETIRVLLLLATVVSGGAALAYEEPAYEVLGEYDAYEIRRYAPYLVAETTVEGSFDEAGSRSFRRLFGYISGNNRRAERVDAAVPVSVGSADRGEEIKMTIPVVTTMPSGATVDSAAYTYYFVMPSKFTAETLPRPNDERIRIREVPERVAAVVRYSGRSNEANYRENEQLLREALEADGVPMLGEPVFAVYNGPFTPWFMRRNEIMVEIEAKSVGF